MFKVGQKVIFIGFSPLTWREWFRHIFHPIPEPLPVKGEVYTIATIHVDGTGPYLSLLELKEETNEWWGEGWDSRAFRPVVERKADISVFTEMLTPSPALVKELCGNG